MVYKSIDELIGNTPLLELVNIEKEFKLNAKLFAKIESFNPGGSVKDRVAKSMLDDAEEKGLINKNSVIIEPTSGNTGIGLAAIGTSRGYRVIIVMPETMSIERRILMQAYGAELVLTDGRMGMTGAIKKAEELFDQAIKRGPAEDPEVYWATQRQKIYFLSQIGRNQECIEKFLPLVEAGSNELQEWICLIQTYSFAKDYDTTWEWIKKAEAKFPESAILHIYTGDILRATKRYDEAFPHWERALEMEPDWTAAVWSIASCYEELGNYAKAYEVYSQIADDLESQGFDAEVDLPRSLANKCQKKIST